VIFVYATPTTVFYTLSLHDALPISVRRVVLAPPRGERRGCNHPAGRFVRSPSPVRCLARAALAGCAVDGSFMEKLLIIDDEADRSEEPRLNSSHVKISYAVFCLKKK